jgi:hypothetical protein
MVGPVADAQAKASTELDAKAQPVLAPIEATVLTPFAEAVAAPLAAKALEAYDAAAPAHETATAEYKEQLTSGAEVPVAQAQLQKQVRPWRRPPTAGAHTLARAWLDRPHPAAGLPGRGRGCAGTERPGPGAFL